MQRISLDTGVKVLQKPFPISYMLIAKQSFQSIFLIVLVQCEEPFVDSSRAESMKKYYILCIYIY